MNGNDNSDKDYWEQQKRQTQELRESLPEHFKAHTAKQIIDYLDTLSPEDKDAWIKHIGNDPILQRTIYYVSSPPEETIGRFDMILTFGSENFIRDMEYIYFALEQPEIFKNNTLRLFLIQMKEDCLRIMMADTIKIEGSKEDINELRSKAIVREGGKLAFNLSRSRMDVTRSRIEVHVLDERIAVKDTSHYFTVDDLLVRQLQEYNETSLRWEMFNDPMEVYVYDRSGNLLKPPPGYRNPFNFSLRKRYEELIQSQQKKWCHIFDEDEIDDAFEQSTLTTKSGNPRYIKQRMKWKLLDMNKVKRRLVSFDDAVKDTGEENIDPEQSWIQKEYEAERSKVLALIKQDQRLSRIIYQGSRRSVADQKYFQRTRNKLIKKSRALKEKK